MFVKDVMVKNQVGLHARPATFLFRKLMNLNHLSGSKRKNAELTLKVFSVSFHWGL